MRLPVRGTPLFGLFLALLLFVPLSVGPLSFGLPVYAGGVDPDEFEPEFLRGDVNADLVVSFDDAFALLCFVGCLTSSDFKCEEAADVDGNGTVAAIPDAVYLLKYLFGDGDEPPDPGPFECGPGTSRLSCKNPPDCDDDKPDIPSTDEFTLSIISNVGTPERGDDFRVGITLDGSSDDVDLNGVVVTLCHDSDVLDLDDKTDLALAPDLKDDDDLMSFVRIGDDGWVVSILPSSTSDELPVLNADGGLLLLTARYQLLSVEKTKLVFCDGFNDRDFPSIVILDGKAAFPDTVDEEIDPNVALYKRGDVNADGKVSPLRDAIYLLEYGFLSGPMPPCFAAADVDGSGSLGVLRDAIFLLNWAFNEGEKPPEPGPIDCGRPTDRDLPCAVLADECLGEL